MKSIKFSTEAIVGIIAGLVILVVLIYAFNQKRETKALETQKQLENAHIDSLQAVVNETTLFFRDSLLMLEQEIEKLKVDLQTTDTKQSKTIGYNKLDELVQASRVLIKENKEALIRLKEESPKSEYTPQFFVNLLEALIENIQLKELRISELENQIASLRHELDNERAKTRDALAKRDALEMERQRIVADAEQKTRALAKTSEEKSKLLIFQYILGSQKELIKEEVLTKRFLRKECFMSNNIPPERFITIKLDDNNQSIVLGEVSSNEVFCAPTLFGATTAIENDLLILHVTNLNQLANNGRVVFYY